MIISLENISKTYAGERVLDNAALTIENADRIGLIGINGCGKSTLLRIITGQEHPDSQPEPNPPRISRTNARIGFLAQDSGLSGDDTVIDSMRAVFAELLGVAARLDELRANISGETADEYSRLNAYFEANDGYIIDVKINKVLRGMGFPPELYSRVVSTLSGGERTRLALAKLLLEEPELLILDEPTNHLDFDTVIWLEDYLADYRGALLIVSHDRYFLDKLCTSICEIERGTLRRFKGNYTAFTAQKEAYVEYQLKEYEAQQLEIAKLKDYIARNAVRASTANMAKSRVKQLEKIEANPIRKPVLGEKSAKIAFEYDSAKQPPKELLKVEGVDLTVGEGEQRKTLINSLSFELRKGEKLAIVGANGIGKSTLLKVLLGKHPHFRGVIEWGENTKISYFEQNSADISDSDTVMNAVHKLYPRMTELAVRNLLGGVRLTGDDVYKQVGDISGGERAKLRLAIMTLERGNVLVLDEPTNHIDIATRDVLENALCGYTGTIVFVSHDRYLLNKLATRVLRIEPDRAVSYGGGFAEFEKAYKSPEPHKPESSESPDKPEKSESKSGNYRSKEQRALEAQRRTRLRQVEARIDELESLLAQLQREMESPEVFANHELLQEKCSLYEDNKAELSRLSDEWLELCDE